MARVKRGIVEFRVSQLCEGRPGLAGVSELYDGGEAVGGHHEPVNQPELTEHVSQMLHDRPLGKILSQDDALIPLVRLPVC